MYWSQYPADIRFWPILGKWNWYNRSKYKDFWMGPSVKFVSRINGSFSKENYWSIFFLGKKGKRGGRGSEGGLSKTQFFPLFFFGTLPLELYCYFHHFFYLINAQASIDFIFRAGTVTLFSFQHCKQIVNLVRNIGLMCCSEQKTWKWGWH